MNCFWKSSSMINSIYSTFRAIQSASILFCRLRSTTLDPSRDALHTIIMLSWTVWQEPHNEGLFFIHMYAENPGNFHLIRPLNSHMAHHKFATPVKRPFSQLNLPNIFLGDDILFDYAGLLAPGNDEFRMMVIGVFSKTL